MNTEKARKYIEARIKIDPITGCHIWQLKPGASGYGPISPSWRLLSSVSTAHQLSYLAYNGEIPQDTNNRLLICHECPKGSNKLCVNPEHLFARTPTQNSFDRLGENNNQAKLTSSKVTIIKQRLFNGDKGKDIAKDFDITTVTISHIKTGNTWKHVKALPLIITIDRDDLPDVLGEPLD